MELKEFYERIGGNYGDMVRRLPNEARIRKFLIQFTGDENFSLLGRAMEEGDGMTAFRAAHTIKGLCMNLGLARLQQSSSALTESLRPGVMNPEAGPLFERVALDYADTIGAIGLLSGPDTPGEGGGNHGK